MTVNVKINMGNKTSKIQAMELAEDLRRSGNRAEVIGGDFVGIGIAYLEASLGVDGTKKTLEKALKEMGWNASIN